MVMDGECVLRPACRCADVAWPVARDRPDYDLAWAIVDAKWIVPLLSVRTNCVP